MKFKHSDIEIPREDPFKNCKLNRQPNAIILTQIVQNYSDSFVLSINGEWGTGKTTFMKMWAAASASIKRGLTVSPSFILMHGRMTLSLTQ